MPPAKSITPSWVEEESTATVMTALREVIERKGAFCALYSDRASHFFHTPKAGQPVDRQRPTQVGRALAELGIRMIPAYSPQARGRGERSFGTWQGRLPQELRLRGIETLEEANAFLRQTYIAEFNSKFTVAAAESGTAFMPLQHSDLNRVFAIQHERTGFPEEDRLPLRPAPPSGLRGGSVPADALPETQKGERRNNPVSERDLRFVCNAKNL